MRQKKKRVNPYKRKLDFGDDVWTFRTASGGVQIRPPSLDKTYNITMQKLTGWSHEDIQRARKKGITLPQVTPGKIRVWIERIIKCESEGRTWNQN